MESLSVQVLRRLPVGGGADGPHGAARIGATSPVRAFLCFPPLGRHGSAPVRQHLRFASGCLPRSTAPPPRTLHLLPKGRSSYYDPHRPKPPPSPPRLPRGVRPLHHRGAQSLRCLRIWATTASISSSTAIRPTFTAAPAFPPFPQCRTSFRRCCRSSPSAHGLIFSKPRWWRC